MTNSEVILSDIDMGRVDVFCERGIKITYRTTKNLSLTLAYSSSYQDLNDKAIGMFGLDKWTSKLISMVDYDEGGAVPGLLADIYKRYNKVVSKPRPFKKPVENNNVMNEEKYESVNGPQHYNGTDCIDKMRKMYGDDAVRWFCICNSYKYRYRAGKKPSAKAEEDLKKAEWYENYAATEL